MTALPNPFAEIAAPDPAEPAARNIDHLIDMEALERAIAGMPPESLAEDFEAQLRRCREDFFAAVKPPCYNQTDG